MPSKNDLSSLKQRPQGKLKVVTDNKIEPVNSIVKKKVGRRLKPADEKESFTLPLKLTEAEGALLKEKAGLVPLATYVKAYLREHTKLLK